MDNQSSMAKGRIEIRSVELLTPRVSGFAGVSAIPGLSRSPNGSISSCETFKETHGLFFWEIVVLGTNLWPLPTVVLRKKADVGILTYLATDQKWLTWLTPNQLSLCRPLKNGSFLQWSMVHWSILIHFLWMQKGLHFLSTHNLW